MGARCKGVTQPYTAADVYRLRGSIDIEYSLARYGAARLWQLFQDDDYVAVLSAVTGNQAIQQVQAGLKAIYVRDRKSTRLNSSHSQISYAVFCLKKKQTKEIH